MSEIDFNGPLFILTGDIDSTVFTDERLNLLRSNLAIAKEHGVPYWIFITPTPLSGLPKLISEIRSCNDEVIFGVHGFTHVPFEKLSYQEQTNQWLSAKRNFERIGIRVNATRTPELSLNKYTFRCIAALDFKYDFSTSFGFQATSSKLFLKPRTLRRTVFLPLTLPTDTYFRKKNMCWREIEREWKRKAQQISEKRGIISVLAHPMGYEQVPSALEKLLDFIQSKEIRSMNDGLFSGY